MGAKGSDAPSRVNAAQGDSYSVVAALLSRLVTNHSLKILVALVGQLIFACVWSHQLKNEKGMAAVVPKAENSVLRDFPDSAEKIRDVMVFWCKDRGCDLTKMNEFSIERKAVQGLLDTLRARNRFCSDLGWSSIDTTNSNSLLTALKFPYISADKTTAFVEYHSTKRECMRDLRRKLQRGFHRSTGPLLMSLGGPESVAGASMDAELRSMMKHAYIAVPLSCLLLWLFVGNLFRVFTPVICMVASYLSGQAVVGLVKQYLSPGLNVQYDDSFVLFIDLALCVDYALFFWTRFAVERASHGFEDSLRQTMQTSGAVITVSNFFVVVAWTCTLCFPNLNLWGFQGLYLEALSGCAFAGIWSLGFTAAAAAHWPSLFDNGPSPLGNVHEAFWRVCPKGDAFWKPWAKKITSRPLMFILPCLAYACMIPCIIAVTKYHPSFDVQKQGVRRDTLEHEALMQFEQNFRIGMLSPVTLVLEAAEIGPNNVDGRRSHRHRLVPASSIAELQKDYPELASTGDVKDTVELASTGDVKDIPQPDSAGDVQELQLASTGSLKEPLTALAEQFGMDSQALLRQLAAGGVETPSPSDVSSLLQLLITPSFAVTNGPERLASDRSNQTAAQKVSQHFAKSAGKVAQSAGKAIRKLALNPEFGQLVCTIAEAIINKTRGREYEIQMADMLSIWWLPPQAGKTGCAAGTAKMVMHQQVNNANLETAVQNFFPPILRKSISKDGKKVLLKLFTRFSPSSPEAVDFDKMLRKQLESDATDAPRLFEIGGRNYALKVHHTSAVARQVEANREMALAAPRIFGIFAALIAVLITVAFRSAFLCVKLAMTVLAPIVATYGVTVAVYQLDVLGFMGAELFKGTGGLDFRMIYVTPGVLFGLAMDYDLFLFARAYEHRLEGYDNTSAVRRALEETGPVITAAGVLMAISFFAIMLSNTILFRTLGFVFFFGVTFDVFIIRTCIAPVFLCLAERLNYWPREMPIATKKWE